MERSTNNTNIVKSVYICDKCGQGEMKPTGVTFLTNPAKYEHKCENCEDIKEFNKCYPSITIMTDVH